MLRVISLSTIPPRFQEIGPTLDSLAKQAGVDEIRLYIPRAYRRFPEYSGELPDVPDRIKIIRPDDDLGPASKVLFAIQSLRETEAQILFCDDDRIYQAGWAERLLSEQSARPEDCVAVIGKDLPASARSRQPRAVRARRTVKYRARRIYHRITKGNVYPRPEPVIIAKPGYVDVLQGYGGAVVRPRFFDDQAFDIPDVLWTVDDYWLSGLLAARGIGIWLPAGFERPAATSANDLDALFDATIDGAGRLEANQQCISYMQRHFHIWS